MKPKLSLVISAVVVLLGILALQEMAYTDSGVAELEMHVRSQATSQSALSLTAELVTLGLLIFIILSILGLGLWSLVTQRPPREMLQLGLKSSVPNLFLAIQYYQLKQLPDTKSEQLGFLRTLGVRYATVVTTTRHRKGERVVLKLSSLPDFPGDDILIDAAVTRCTILGGSPANYQVDVRFLAATDDVKNALNLYLIELTKRRRYAYS